MADTTTEPQQPVDPMAAFDAAVATPAADDASAPPPDAPAPHTDPLAAFDEAVAAPPAATPADPHSQGLEAFDAATAPAEGSGGGVLDAVKEFLGKPKVPVTERYQVDTGSRTVTDDELRQIAAKHGVDEAWLREHANYFGAFRPAEPDASLADRAAEAGKRVLGGASALLSGGGIANEIAKHTVDDPKKIDALDDLRDMVEEKTGKLEHAIQLGGGGLAVSKLFAPAKWIGEAAKLGTVAKAGLGLAEAGGIGALYGASNAHQGDEAHEAKVGAVLGVGLGAIIHGAMTGVTKAAGYIGERLGLTGAAAEAAATAVRDTEAEAAATLARRAPEEAVLEETVLRNPEARTAATQGDGAALLQAVEPEQAQALQKLALDTGYVSREVAHDAEAMERGVAQLVSDHTEAVERAVGVGSRVESLAEAASVHGEQFMQTVSRAERLGAELAEQADRFSGELVGQTGKPVGAVVRKMKGMRSVISDYDSRLGTELMKPYDALVTGLQKAEGHIRDAAFAVQGVMRAVGKAAGKTASGAEFDLMDAAERGARGLASGEYTPKQEEAIRAVDSFFRRGREDAVARGLPIAELADMTQGAGYMPHFAVDAGEAALRLEREAKSMRINFTSDSDLAHFVARADTAEASREAAFIQALEYTTGRDLERASPTDLRAAMASLTEPSTLPMRRAPAAAPSAGVASVSRTRGAGVPDLIRDRNVPRVMMRWASAVNKAIETREPLAELAARARALREVAPEVEARVGNLVRDVSGGRFDTVSKDIGSRSAAFAAQQRVLAERATDPVVRATHRALAVLPETLSFMQRQIMPAALGLRPDIAVRHLIQPFTMALPEIGWQKGARYFAQALLQTAADIGSPGKLMADLRARGLTDSAIPVDVLAAVRHGLNDSPLRRTGSAALEGFNRAVMIPLHGALTIARATTMHMADALAADMMRKPELAEYVVGRVDSGLRSGLSAALTAGDARSVQTTVNQWLSAKTMLQFNKATMSEFGREMGSFFTAFSSFPVAVVSDLHKPVDVLASKGLKAAGPEALRVAAKYLPTLALAASVHQKWTDAVEAHPALGQVIGKDPVKTIAPLEALSYVKRGGPLSSPAVKAATGLVDLAMHPSSILPALHSALIQTIPGNALFRFLYEDLPKYGGPELPGGAVLRRPSSKD